MTEFAWPWMASPFANLLASAFIISTTIYLIRVAFLKINSTKQLNLPVVGKPGDVDFRMAMEEGTRRYPDTPWILPLTDPTVIIPTALVDEVKSLPESKASLNANNYRRFFGRYTMMGTDDDEFVSAVKLDLTRNVGDMLNEMAEEMKFAMDQSVGSCKGDAWTSIAVYPTMLKVIALVSSRTFVGLPLSRNPEWIESTIHYAIDSVAAGDRLRTFPRILQPLTAPFLPQIWSVWKHQKRVRSMLRPLLAEHSKFPHHNHGSSSEKGRLLSWLLSHYKDGRANETRLGNDHLLAAFAAIHIATNALTHILLDLAARPEYIQSLREELEEVLGSGTWQTATLAKLVKMDSFIKESLRINPPGGVVTIMRRTTAPLPLSCGVTIPSGVLVAFPNTRFDFSKPLTGDPDTFDGFRYSNLRKQSNEPKYQLTGSGPDSLTFGYGSHVCPGRSFAAAELKLALAYVIMCFDVMLEVGRPRPENSSRDFQIMPHPHATILLKARH